MRGDKDDVLSGGFICPKAHGLKQLHEDPDRLTTPLIRRGGELVEATWDEAFEEIDRRLSPILAEHGKNSVAVYIGNPNAHNLSALVYGPVWLRALGTQNIYSRLHGRPDAQAGVGRSHVRDDAVRAGAGRGPHGPPPHPGREPAGLEREPAHGTGHARPPAPHSRARRQGRGGRPAPHPHRRGRRRAPLHPAGHGRAAPCRDGLHAGGGGPRGTRRGRRSPQRPGSRCPASWPTSPPNGWRRPAASRPRRSGGWRGSWPPPPAPPCTRRIGTCTQEFGTLASWLVDVLNALTGNLDREGGAMFPLAAAGQKNASGAGGAGRGVRLGRWHTRVRRQAESYGELPVACLAEEIDTPGEGQVRALVTVAGNPVVSTPNPERLESAIEGLDFMLAVDIYVNETTRHADVILPAPEPLEKSHYDLALYQLAVHNVANYSPAGVRGLRAGRMGDLPAPRRRAGGSGAAGRRRGPRRPGDRHGRGPRGGDRRLAGGGARSR